ncbi:hypothetical protein ASC94_06195 [Massilia sp. Root418]|jgi:hypothetical protein|uniref:hypothetical protein n=1 Tax=Massilia sp. Root418 TaxID=1736532 RepID=UPI0006FC42F7|nr:hypothetical protein [Massilia sp. Root418]KQW96438.1 hypothetical protein ASC94_06195 [Massilia sp. Root418]
MISSVSSLNPASGLVPQRKIAEPEAPPDVDTVAPDPQSISGVPPAEASPEAPPPQAPAPMRFDSAPPPDTTARLIEKTPFDVNRALLGTTGTQGG